MKNMKYSSSKLLNSVLRDQIPMISLALRLATCPGFLIFYTIFKTYLICPLGKIVIQQMTQLTNYFFIVGIGPGPAIIGGLMGPIGPTGPIGTIGPIIGGPGRIPIIGGIGP